MTIIPNGFNNLAGRVGMRERHLPDSPARLLFVGQLKDIKQVDRILVAVSEWEGITLRLVYHNAELESELRALVTKLGIEDRAVFVGQRWGSQLLDEYLAADLLVLPSRSESLPSVVAEALACGLPIVASEVGGIAEQVGGAGVLVAPSRSVPIVGALRSAVAGYEALARRARERAVEVQDQFSAEVMADRHLELYERLLGST
jgi:glycosyltransferase involved in cell wall biosynthesis